jgi:hypothetical protein
MLLYGYKYFDCQFTKPYRKRTGQIRILWINRYISGGKYIPDIFRVGLKIRLN